MANFFIVSKKMAYFAKDLMSRQYMYNIYEQVRQVHRIASADGVHSLYKWNSNDGCVVSITTHRHFFCNVTRSLSKSI